MYSSTILPVILAALTAASPLPQSSQSSSGTVTLQIGISTSGDDSTTRTIPFAKLFPNNQRSLPPASSIVVGGSNNIPIDDKAIVCQAFSDAAGKQKLGSTFNNVLPGIKLANGDSLTNIGSVFCSDAAGVAAFSSNTGNGGSVDKVSIKLDFDIAEEGASVGNVPVNGQLVLVKNIFATRVAHSAEIQSGEGDISGVTCEAFGDEAGKKKIGVVKGDGQEVVFAKGNEDVPIGAFKCTSA